MGSWADRTWLVADDDAVEARLRAELEHSEGAAPEEILGTSDPGEARAVFLEGTKTFHPSRFARRSAEIRRLANEVFLNIMAAYKALEARTAPPAEPVEATEPAQPPVAAGRSRPRTLAEEAARRELRERRRETLRQRLTPAAGVAVAPRSQARVASAADPSAPKMEGDPEPRFRMGIAQLEAGRLEDAATTFKELAVSDPSEKRYRLYMHYAWGQQAEAEGRLDEARAEYKRALGLDAAFGPALQAMSSLPSTGKRRDGGLFTKWFRK